MSATATEALNLRRTSGPAMYEVWYLTWNDVHRGDGFWLRFVIEGGHGEVWFARFGTRGRRETFGIRRRFALPAGGHTLPFALEIGGAELRHDGTRGELSGGGHTVSWDLSWASSPQPLLLLPDVFYRRDGLADTTVQSPNPRVVARGEVTVDLERYELANAWLGQSHLWGRRHAHAWTWAHVADETAVVELLAVRLERGGRVLPQLTLVVGEVDGEPVRLNQLHRVAFNRTSAELGRIDFEARAGATRVRGHLTCRLEDLIDCPYVDPDGTPLWCANTEIGDARITFARRTWWGWRTWHELDVRGTAHFEHGRRERDSRVTHEHVLVAE